MGNIGFFSGNVIDIILSNGRNILSRGDIIGVIHYHVSFHSIDKNEKTLTFCRTEILKKFAKIFV